MDIHIWETIYKIIEYYRVLQKQYSYNTIYCNSFYFFINFIQKLNRESILKEDIYKIHLIFYLFYIESKYISNKQAEQFMSEY